MNSARLIYKGKLRLSFDIPFLDTPSYLYALHLYTSTLFYVFSCDSGRGSTCVSGRVSDRVSGRVSACDSGRSSGRSSGRASTHLCLCPCLCPCLLASSHASLCTSYRGLGREV